MSIIAVVIKHTSYLQVTGVLLIVQVGEPINNVIEDSARYKLLLN